MAKDTGKGADGATDVDDLDDLDDGTDDAPPKGSDKGNDDSVRDAAGVLRKNRELAARIKELKKTAAAFDGIDAAKAKLALERIDKLEEEEARAAGKWDQMKQKMADKHMAELSKEQRKNEKMKAKLYKTLAQDNIIRALADETDTPELLVPHIERYVQVVAVGDEDDPEDFDVVVLGKDGKPRVKNGSGDPFTISDLVTEMRDQPTYQPAFRAKVGSGTGHRAGGGGATGVRNGVLRIANADAKDPAKYRAAKVEAEKVGARVEIV